MHVQVRIGDCIHNTCRAVYKSTCMYTVPALLVAVFGDLCIATGCLSSPSAACDDFPPLLRASPSVQYNLDRIHPVETKEQLALFEGTADREEKKKKIHSHAGNRTPATAVRAPDPNH